MKLSRPLLHAARLADALLFWPMLGYVVYGELLAPESDPVLSSLPDKVLHLNAYFILAGMAAAAVNSRRTAILAVLALIVLGGVLEIVQGMVGRDMSIYDELANATGAILGGGLARMAIEPLRKRFAA